MFFVCKQKNSSRGVYLKDSTTDAHDIKGSNNSSMIQNIVTDRRMLHLPMSLRDVVIENLLSSGHRKYIQNRRRRTAQNTSKTSQSTTIQLLSYPRIVGSAPPSSGSSAFFSVERASNGISCMDLDHGRDGTLSGSPPRYLLVGSGGGDCSIALYDLSYFGSDQYLYQKQSTSSSSQFMNSQSIMHNRSKNNQASVTHRPIARSLRHQSSTSAEENASGVPSGHRQPLLGVHWYPGDVKGAFVSASISGEILVWDACSFTPVFATYCHIYTGMAGMSAHGIARGNLDEEGKAVAPLQCMDLPKTPEGCPHGNALLALGLGADGRGVIQLCDAFRGGSATHELVGHGTGGGGVNCVAWDPYHPFRLASGGDDCTVRLWDIRKAGSAACLGVLNRENEMYSSKDTTLDHWEQPPRKKQRADLLSTNNSRTSGIESHGAPVTAVTFAPGGDDLVSTGLDGRIHHWDLRPDSCFVSSVAAISGDKGSRTMDPLVATGGRLFPTSFTGGVTSKQLPGNSKPWSSKRRHSRQKALLAILQPGSRCTTTLLSTVTQSSNSSKGQITGYSLFGRRGKEPGCPEFDLSGHLSDVTCLIPIAGGTWDNLMVGGRRNENTHHVNFLTGGKDGMVLSWGNSRRQQHNVSSSTDESDVYSNQTSAQEPQSVEDLDNW